MHRNHSVDWEFIGEGSNNRVYLNKQEGLVLKIMKKSLKDGLTDSPERSVRLWNLINSKITPSATIVSLADGKTAWVAPYVQGRQSTDIEMKNALIEIYNSTGRIIVDAPVKENFITTDKDQVVCVDIGMALQMEYKDDEILKSDKISQEEKFFTKSIRRKSIISLDTWEKIKKDHGYFFQLYAQSHSQTIKTIKALLFIKNKRPDILDVSFLKSDPENIKLFAKAYGVIRRFENQSLMQEAKKNLDNQQTLTFDKIKESCLKEINRYINSYGSIDSNGKFQPSFITQHFRNLHQITESIVVAQSLASTITKASTLTGLGVMFKKAEASLDDSNIPGGLSSSLLKCVEIVKTAKKSHLLIEEAMTTLDSKFPLSR